MFDGERSMYFADESSYQKKEAELAKKLVSLFLSLVCRLVFQNYVTLRFSYYLIKKKESAIFNILNIPYAQNNTCEEDLLLRLVEIRRCL
jgi:hypothetical protein